MLRTLFIALAGLALAVGCAPQPTPMAPKPAGLKPWSASTTDPNDPSPAFLSNGLIGFRLDRGAVGKGLPFLSADVRQKGGEEKIIPLDNPMGLVPTYNGKTVSPQEPSNYVQTLDFKTGFLTTTWNANLGGETVRIQIKSAISPTRRLVAQKATASPLPKGLTFAPAAKSQSPLSVHSFETTDGLQVSYAVAFRQNPDSAELALAMAKPAGSPASDTPVDLNNPVWFDQVAKESLEWWAKRWRTDIVIDGPEEDQQAIRSMLFALRSGLNPNSGYAPGPFGLTSASYNGHVFWDADLWIFPALMLTDPDLAKAIPDYRLRMLEKRIQNGLKMGGQPFPWESSESGKETVPGPSQKEIHIAGSVSLGLEWAAALGLANPAKVREAQTYASAFYVARSKPGPTGERSLKDVMSPDEFHTGDNDLYTNMLAHWVTNKFPERSARFDFVFPKDQTTFLTYEGDRLKSYKQAAAVLTLYPLQHPLAEAEAKAMMERFAGKATQNGPAMTHSVEALIWARLGERDKAYEVWREGWQRYTTRALGLFHEKPKRDSAVFLTGAGGSLQTILYGFAGFRIDSKKMPKTDWEEPMKSEMWLSISPNLPAAWRRLTIKNASILGRRLTFDVTPEAVHVTQGDY